jgi:uncharacterized protein
MARSIGLALLSLLSLMPLSGTQSVGETAPRPGSVGGRIVAGARAEVARGVDYKAAYEQISYPGGDVPRDHGVCTDVVIRAFRSAGMDLQKLIHEDMRANFRAYPKNWGLKRPDTNIDHRRVPNQMTFFRRKGLTLPLATTGVAAGTWRAGDVVCWKLDSGLDHCGVVSDRQGRNGVPHVIHNLGRAAEEDVLTAWKITGHFRYPKR